MLLQKNNYDPIDKYIILVEMKVIYLYQSNVYIRTLLFQVDDFLHFRLKPKASNMTLILSIHVEENKK